MSDHIRLNSIEFLDQYFQQTFNSIPIQKLAKDLEAYGIDAAFLVWILTRGNSYSGIAPISNGVKIAWDHCYFYNSSTIRQI
jgi:hypothetical protein